MVTTTAAGAIWAGADPLASGAAFAAGLPFSFALLAILLCHELGHYGMCIRHGVRASLPYFLPAPPFVVPLGTFGAFIRIRSRFPDRRALFDVGAAGPWAGFVVAVVVLIVGLTLSHAGEPSSTPALIFGDSLLTSWLTRIVVGADPERVIVHPVALAGWFGLFVTSLNLLPAGQLDGGHVLYAALGHRTPALSAMLAGGLVWLGMRLWPGWFVWAGIIAFMSVLGHPPTDADRISPGVGRLVATGLSLVLFALTFVPDPIRLSP
jgi:membrane-associated protease RseP (regulator of RpoE activity)